MRNIAKIVRMVTVINHHGCVYRMELGSTDDLQFARNINLNYMYLPTVTIYHYNHNDLHKFLHLCTQMINLHQRGPSQAEFRLHYHKLISEK